MSIRDEDFLIGDSSKYMRFFQKDVRAKQGRQPEPFLVKQEFAPSDRNLITKRQRFATDLISPHFRLLQFLSSHFSATRLGSPHVQRLYQRLINMTLDALSERGLHPLTREAHFHIVLLGLRVLRYSSNLDSHILWRFKDRLLTASLAWFAHGLK